MRLVETLIARAGDGDVLDAHLAFHLAAGVDVVLVSADTADAQLADVLERHAAADAVHVAYEHSAGQNDERRTSLARAAVAEHSADWVLDAEVDEFWWPRGESLKDAVSAMPQRYGIVQGLVRLFVPAPGEAPFAERMTKRRSLDPPNEPDPLEWALRPLYRADPELVVGSGGRGRVPLRAWYPFEVLTFPFRSVEQAERRLDDGRPPRSTLEATVAAAARDASLGEVLDDFAGEPGVVPDTRVRDALRTLGREGQLAFRAPDIVDDAAYAVECAAVGEVDLPRLEAYVADLEARVIGLEQRFWPRVQRRLARLGRRS